MLHCIIKPFDDLSKSELYEILKARCEVFTVEQHCRYQDLDDIDQSAHHIWTTANDNSLSSYCRLVSPDVKYGTPSIGRVLTLKEHRGQGISRNLLQHGMNFSREIYPGKPIVVSAQAYLENFYSSLGFVREGNIYIEADIEHVYMKSD